ncbi:hypothetical protein QQX98_011970 [Neonectria punicea]|uniref:Uncharacterized protein n=1 Tax=Neonectria punicea TaxID=979145 RepID=A0ABR1GKC5_9HYPO
MNPRANEKKIKERFPQPGNRVVTEGLLLGPYITIDSWEEIFTDDLPAGRLIAAATDETIWVGHQAGGAAEGDDSDVLMADEDNNDDDDDDDDDNDEVNDLPQSQLPDSLQLSDSLLPGSLPEGGHSQPADSRRP